MDEFLAANRLNWDDRARLHATDTTGMYGIARGDRRRRLPARDRSRRDRRRRRQAARPPPVPHRTRTRSASPTAARSRRASISPTRRSPRRATSRSAPVATCASSSPTSTKRRPRSERPTRSPTSPGAPSTGCPTSLRWAQVVADVLEPGGFLYLAESHPNTLCLEEIEGRLVPHYAWRTPRDAAARRWTSR